MGIVWLRDAEDAAALGNKGVSLGKLLRAGFDTANGFVIPIDLDPVSAASQILEAFDALGSETVAVRSSAISEDGQNTAWAGQLETFLYVTRPQLFDKIVACRASAHASRVQAYASAHDTQLGDVAVIIQAMIASEISGVAFSIHPVTNNDKQVIIEAVWGLGEGLVSGHLIPDSYIIDKLTRHVLEKHCVKQEKALMFDKATATSWQSVAMLDTPTLNHEQILHLTDIVISLEEFFGFPVDVEWAYANKRFYIMQSRAITTLPKIS